MSIGNGLGRDCGLNRRRMDHGDELPQKGNSKDKRFDKNRHSLKSQ